MPHINMHLLQLQLPRRDRIPRHVQRRPRRPIPRTPAPARVPAPAEPQTHQACPRRHHIQILQTIRARAVLCLCLRLYIRAIRSVLAARVVAVAVSVAVGRIPVAVVQVHARCDIETTSAAVGFCCPDNRRERNREQQQEAEKRERARGGGNRLRWRRWRSRSRRSGSRCRCACGRHSWRGAEGAHLTYRTVM